LTLLLLLKSSACSKFPRYQVCTCMLKNRFVDSRTARRPSLAPYCAIPDKTQPTCPQLRLQSQTESMTPTHHNPSRVSATTKENNSSVDSTRQIYVSRTSCTNRACPLQADTGRRPEASFATCASALWLCCTWSSVGIWISAVAKACCILRAGVGRLMLWSRADGGTVIMVVV
jgi:hypothetical protein